MSQSCGCQHWPSRTLMIDLEHYLSAAIWKSLTLKDDDIFSLSSLPFNHFKTCSFCKLHQYPDIRHTIVDSNIHACFHQLEI